MRRVYIVGGGDFGSERDLFVNAGWGLAKHIEDASLVLFTGGEDISPSIYGQSRHHYTYFNPHRDEFEIDQWCEATQHGIAMVGICRGAQLLCALNGGTLYQHVTDHTREHHVLYELPNDRGNSFHTAVVNSVHHQMMRPSEDGKVVMWTTVAERKEYVEPDGSHTVIFRVSGDDAFNIDPEVVVWRSNNSLGWQGHPEWSNSNIQDLFFEFLHTYLSF